MRVLEITFEAPSKKSGGGIGICQSICSLVGNAKVDYIGPEYISNELSAKVAVLKILRHKKGMMNKLKALLHGVTTGYFTDWLLMKKSIEWSRYDFVHVEFSRWPFVVKTAHKAGVPVIVRVHNVESDYFFNLFKRDRSLQSFFLYLHYRKEEKKCVRLSDALICLTKEDKERLVSLYGKDIENKIVCNPVCVEDSFVDDKRILLKRKNVLITGSLWYGPNADGVSWFLKNVWKKLQEEGTLSEVILNIAGAKPNDEICSLARELSNVNLYANPESMEELFREAYCYVAPVFSGAGMKVKIAEALMYGLPIIATPHALIGYDHNNEEMIFEDSEGCINAIKKMLSMNATTYIEECQRGRRIYLEHYSYESSVECYKKLFERFAADDK